MNVLLEETRIAQEERLSRTTSFDFPAGPRHGQHRRHRARAVDLHRHQTRWIGVGLCVISAMITLASATLIAVRF